MKICYSGKKEEKYSWYLNFFFLLFLYVGFILWVLARDLLNFDVEGKRKNKERKKGKGGWIFFFHNDKRWSKRRRREERRMNKLQKSQISSSKFWWQIGSIESTTQYAIFSLDISVPTCHVSNNVRLHGQN